MLFICLFTFASAVPLQRSLADSGARLGVPLSQADVPIQHAPLPLPGALMAAADHYLFLPVSRIDTTSFQVNTQNKAESQWAYQAYYLPFQSAEISWTGDHATCAAGTTAAGYRDALQRLVNYYRAMAGVPATVTFNDATNAKAQQAALMMSVNKRLSHTPDPDWTCYTAAGAEAAGRSNLSYWYGYGGDYHGILGQMRDQAERDGAPCSSHASISTFAHFCARQLHRQPRFLAENRGHHEENQQQEGDITHRGGRDESVFVG